MAAPHSDLGFKPIKAAHDDLGFVPMPSDEEKSSGIDWKEVGLTALSPMATKTGREFLSKVGGGAYGVAETVNPLSVPHGLETMGRFILSKRLPEEGLMQKLERSSREAVIPEMSPSKIAAAGRAFLGNDGTFQDRYQNELAVQKQAEDAVLDPTARSVGQLGTAIAGAVPLAKSALSIPAKIPVVAKKMADFAEDVSFNALKPIKSMAQAILETGRAKPIGRQLLNDKIVTSGASWQQIAGRIDDKLDDYGKVIGHFTKSADQAVSRDSSIRGIQVQDIRNKITNKLIPDLIESGEEDVAKKILSWVDGNLKSAAPTGEIGFEQATNILGKVAKRAKYNNLNPDPASDAFRDIYGILNEERINGIERALKQAGSLDDMDEFLKAKEGYRNLSQAQTIINKTVSGKVSNRAVSPSDWASGFAGALLDSSGSTATKALMGVGSAGLNKLSRERGLQTAASVFDSIAKGEADPRAIGAFNYIMGLGGDE